MDANSHPGTARSAEDQVSELQAALAAAESQRAATERVLADLRGELAEGWAYLDQALPELAEPDADLLTWLFRNMPDRTLPDRDMAPTAQPTSGSPT